MQCRMTLTLAIALSLVSLPVQAQLPQTRLNAVFPAGGQAGSTFDLQITDGADLEDTDKLHFSHPGISATQKMTGAGDSKKPVTNQFVVTIKPDVPVGVYEVRAIGRFGMSNPRSFMVSHRKEIIEAEPNNTSDKATAIEWNQIINARSNGGADLDFYKFTGQAGQRVIIDTLAQRIDSKMKVAVELFDPAGNRMMLKREAFREDPLFDVTLKVDGDYLLKVYDFIYQGGNTHHYRINIGTGPYIDYIWPPAGLAGSCRRNSESSTSLLSLRSHAGCNPVCVSVSGGSIECGQSVSGNRTSDCRARTQQSRRRSPTGLPAGRIYRAISG